MMSSVTTTEQSIHMNKRKWVDNTTKAARTDSTSIDLATKAESAEIINDDRTKFSSVNNNDIHQHMKDNIDAGQNHKSSESNNRTTFHFITFITGMLLRILLLDIPVVSLFALRQGTQLLFDMSTEYFIPQAELQVFTKQKAERDLTYYHRTCTSPDQTTNFTESLIVYDNISSDEATDMMLKHGAIVFPYLLTNETATELRNFILQENLITKELVYVIDNENRWSFPMKVDQHPSIGKALHEILNLQPKLINTLEKIMGNNPAIIEFTAITSGPGAAAQFWHQDVVPATSGAKYGRSFIPSYSLFVPLQNTSAQMGATGICPGSHMCPDGASQFCSQTGFQVSGTKNNWPMGYGALVNQQTTHRGEAHIDYNAPHRVVFILTFAPRPALGKKEIESKLIGQAGSYSLHWSHWGHTLYDYQNYAVNMKQPYRILRSFGLYNPFNDNYWGWDYITVSSGRISCQDNGFGSGDLLEFVEEKGGFPFLPKELHGNRTTNSHGATYRWSWINFLMDTIHKCHKYFSEIHRITLCTYVAVALTVRIISQLMMQKETKVAKATLLSSISKNMIWVCIRLLLLHGIVQLICYGIRHKVSQSLWAQKIRRGQSFQLPEKITTLPPISTFPTTFPNVHDVLIFEQMKSTYMYSYSTILNVFHPGNVEWVRMLRQYSIGYDTLPVSIQQTLRTSLIQWALLYLKSRILTKGVDSNWVKVNNDMAEWYCHQTLLSLQSLSPYPIILTQLDYLLSELKFDYLRDTKLAKRHIIPFLSNLQDNVMKLSKLKNKPLTKDGLPKNDSAFRLQSLVVSIPSSIPYDRSQRKNIFPPSPTLKEPFFGAWMQSGDKVEAAYHGDFGEWYPGFITYVSANRKKWNVRYADGEVDTNLCYECVRPFQPYKIGEVIETRIVFDEDDYVYVPGIIQSINVNYDEYQITLDDGSIISASLSDCRRSYETLLQVHDRVQTLYPGESPNSWFPGTITRVNRDKSTYDVLYDDGDFLTNIPKDQIRLFASQEEKDDDDDDEYEDEVE